MTKATYSELKAKWSSVLNEEAAGEIRDDYRKSVTARLLENQEEVSMLEQEAVNYLAEDGQNNTTAVTGAGTANWNPVLMALVRRAMPNMMAYDLASVQPMTGPTGLVFCMKSKYKTTKAGVSAGDEALFNEPAIGYAADSSTTANGGTSGLAGLLMTPQLVSAPLTRLSMTPVPVLFFQIAIPLLKWKALALLVTKHLLKWASPSTRQLLLLKALR